MRLVLKKIIIKLKFLTYCTTLIFWIFTVFVNRNYCYYENVIQLQIKKANKMPSKLNENTTYISHFSP